MLKKLLIVLALLGTCGLLPVVHSRADLPQTATSLNEIDTSTPLQFMLSYDRLAGADQDAYLPLYQITPDTDDLKLAQAECRFDAQIGMLQKIVQLRFGGDATAQAIHAFGLQTADDIKAAKIVQTGDTAVVTYFDGSAGPQLIKIARGWRLDTSAFRKSLGMPVDAYIKQLHQLALIAADIADAIDKKQLASVDAVAHEIARRTAAVYQ